MSNRKNRNVAAHQEVNVAPVQEVGTLPVYVAPQQEVAPQQAAPADVAPQQVAAPLPETATAILAIPSAAPDATKRNGKHKPGSQVARWRAQPNLPEAGVITVLAKTNPKSQGAATRFALYRTGMLVEDYITAVVQHGQSKAQAKADVRWDVTAGFITVA